MPIETLDSTQDNSYRTGYTNGVTTMYRQVIAVGDQVSYVTPVKLSVVGDSVVAKGGCLKVSAVERVEKVCCGFAEADPVFHLHLVNGDVIDCCDAVKTDGRFEYP